MSQLMVLVFGSKHRQKVIEAFDLMDRQEPEKEAPDKLFRATISGKVASGE